MRQPYSDVLLPFKNNRYALDVSLPLQTTFCDSVDDGVALFIDGCGVDERHEQASKFLMAVFFV